MARLWKWLWRRLAPVAPKQLPAGNSGWVAARARFWTELREGQREAEAQQAASAVRSGTRER
jgi:hypothetical protein